MTSTIREILEFTRENDVKYIRLAFCDLFGVQKNISVMPSQLPFIFENGISFDASAIKGFGGAVKSDLLLFPDPNTIMPLPWRPGPGRGAMFYCDIKYPDGAPYSCDSRRLLKGVLKRCEEMGYLCKIGAECEFYLFKTDEKGEPTMEPLDRGSYFDTPPLDKGEGIRREICLFLEEMGLMPEISHHEQGPGQNEISFRFRNALASADNFLTFKYAVKSIAERNGLYASFMAKPLKEESGSGLHVNVSLSQEGFNIFKSGECHSEAAESFIAGIMDKISEMTLFLNPSVNSYERLGKSKAPKYVSWSHQNRSQLIRIPAAIGEKVRMELRSPDPSVNPYLAFALIISAGLEGINQKLPLPPAVDLDLFSVDEKVLGNMEELPQSLEHAIGRAEKSDFIKGVIGDEVLNKYIDEKKKEAGEFCRAQCRESFSQERYFRSI